MRVLKWVVIAVLAVFVIVTAAGFLLGPVAVRYAFTRILSENLHRQVTVGKITVNPYTLTLTVKDFAVKDRASPETFCSFGDLTVNVQIRSLFSGALVIEELRLNKPYLRVVRNQDESYNFSDLIPPKEQTPPKEEEGKKKTAFLFSVNNISIGGGSVDFIDGPKHTTHTVRDMNITIPFVSNTPGFVNTFVQPSFSAVINGDEYTIRGQTKPFADSLETELDLTIKDLDFPTYLAYSPVKLPFMLPSGAIDLTAKLKYVEYKDRPPTVSLSGSTVLRNLVLQDLGKNPLLRLPSADVAFDALEPLSPNIRINQVALKDLEVVVKRDKGGVVNLQKLAAGMESPEGRKGGAPPRKPPPPTTPAAPSSQKAPTYVTIDAFSLENGKVTVTDEVPEQPVTMHLRQIALKGANISTSPGSTMNLDFSFRLQEKGSIALKGPVTLQPLAVEMALDVRDIAINPLQPYFTDRVKINVTNGAVSTKGTLKVTQKEKEDPAVSYTGNVLVTQFASIDKATGGEFLSFKTFSVDSLDGGNAPLRAHMKGVALADFSARVSIEPDGTINLRKVTEEDGAPQEKAPVRGGQAEVAPPEKKPAPEEATAPPLDLQIGAVTLQGGTISFTDRFIKPSFSARLTEIGGRVSGLSFRKGERADVQLKGSLNRIVPLEIKGKLNPSKEDFFVDLAISFKGLDLSPMTPYSGKYIGYAIEKGQLAMDLKYLIKGRKLEAENVIFFDQFTLGDPVESPDAVKLPVRLAIALLKDRNGEIKLDVPLSGSLDDPQFSIGRIIWKIIVNLITKAVTAPFALLGSLFGGGEQLSYVEFDYGSARLSAENLKKLESLTKALYERPSLRLDIEAYVDVEKDRESLRDNAFSRKIKVQKLNDMIRKGQPAVPVDEVKVEQQEYEKYLTMAYKAEKFAKPKNLIGFDKALPVPEMEKLMITHIEIKEEDLRALAGRRAASVKNALLQSDRITGERIFIVEPKTLAPEKKEKLKDSRADFRIK